MGTPERSRPPLPPSAERRRFERLQLLAQVELRRGGDVALLAVVNISAGGLLVRCEPGDITDLDTGAELSVFLDVADLPEPISFTMEASVVRVTPSAAAPVNIALMWTSVDGEAVAQLARLLGYLSSR